PACRPGRDHPGSKEKASQILHVDGRSEACFIGTKAQTGASRRAAETPNLPTYTMKPTRLFLTIAAGAAALLANNPARGDEWVAPDEMSAKDQWVRQTLL